MAQYWLNAEDHALGTDIETLDYEFGFYLAAAQTLTVVEHNGKKVWESAGNASSNAQIVLDSIAPVSDMEILLLQNFTTTEVSGLEPCVGAAFRADGNFNFSPALGVVYKRTSSTNVSRSRWGSFANETTNNVPANWSHDNLTGFRGQVVGTALKAKAWQHATDLVANEPAGWDYEATLNSVGANGYPAGLSHGNNTKFQFSILAIGTNGDSAPTSAPAQQTVSTPTNLQTQSITATSALLNWD